MVRLTVTFLMKVSFTNISERRKRGFTLIELLLVIAIISVLASIITASLSNTRAKARRAAALSSLRSVVPAAILCLADGATLNCGPEASQSACDGLQIPDVGASVCMGGSPAKWPALPTTWVYYEPWNININAGRFELGGYNTVTPPSYGVDCNQRGCTFY
ncbi:MAG: Uncharacterized protein G01um1014107_57 [Parcubacteria group bacterium Gr01-1014_107]|nr:MAG: Uncharacterized protein G01um1014107_57 [Parcubacteria group bacterium Gr01-1014_107]